MTTRIFVALSDDDFDLLYDSRTREHLANLGEVVQGREQDGSVSVPDNLADEYDILVTSWSTAPFPPSALEGSRLRFAVHSAGSVRKLFPVVALGNTLRVSQGGADALALAVAEMAIALTMAQLRNVVWHDRRFQSSRDWSIGGQGILGQSIAAQRIGIVSLSRVGRHFARMVRGLGATTVKAYDPYASEADARELGVELCGLEELCASSDVLSIHAPSTPETEGLLTRADIARLPDNAVVVNTARAQVADEDALIDEARSGRLRLALDVFTVEPLAADSPLFDLDNVIMTPHVAGGTVQARFAQGARVAQEIELFLTGAPLLGEVTPDNYHRLG